MTPWTAPLTPGMSAAAAAIGAAVPVLATQRLILRAPRLADFATYAAITCSERGVGLGGPMTPEEAWDDFARMTATWLLRGHGAWTVEEGGETLGFVLVGCEPGDAEPELGFLFTAAAEGRGIAAEAARAARAHAFGALGLQRLASYIDPANPRARALAARLGARREGMLDGAEVWRHTPEEAA